MKRSNKALVVDLDAAAEMLLTTTSYLKREIKDGSLRAVRLGSKTVLRVDELKDYLLRKEAEEPAARKVKKGKKAVANDDTAPMDAHEPEEATAPLEASPPPETEPVHQEDVPVVNDDSTGLDEIWGYDSAQRCQE